MQTDAILLAKTLSEAARRSRPSSPAHSRLPVMTGLDSPEMQAALEAVSRCDALLHDAETRTRSDPGSTVLPGQFPPVWNVE